MLMNFTNKIRCLEKLQARTEIIDANVLIQLAVGEENSIVMSAELTLAC